MKKRTTVFTGLTVNTFLLALTSFFGDVATEMLYPILPLFLTQTLGAKADIVGIIEGVATATQNIVQGFSGWIADKIHNRKRVALFGYALAALSKPLMGFASVWQAVLTMRFIDRFGTGVRSAPRDGLIAASADEQNRGKAFGLEGIGDNAGAFLGPLIALFLILSLHFSFRSVFYFSFIPAVLAVVMIFLVREKHVVQKTHTAPSLSLSHFPKKYWVYIGITALFGLGVSSTSFLILDIRNKGIPFATTILIYACYNLVAALISYPAGTLSDKLGRKNILLFAFFIFFLTYIGFAYEKNLFLLGFLFILYGMYQGIFRAVGKAYATDFAPSQLRASGIGWYSTTVGITSLIASIVGGQLWVHIHPQALFLYGSFFAVLGSIGLLLFL